MSASWRLVLVWAALLALLALTVTATFLPLGEARIVVGYAIAAAKAGLVLWFFMELRGDDGLARLAGIAGIVWIALLLVLVAADRLTRGWPVAG